MKKLHRFIGRYQLAKGMIRIDDVDLAHQLRSVLKLAPGETIILGDGTGLEAECQIRSYDRDAVLVDAISVSRNTVELPGHTILYCAVLKGDHFELAAAKAAEIGITEIVPMVTIRTVKLNLRLDRVEKIVREAAELAGRGVVPRVRPVATFDEVLTDASRNEVNFFFDPSGEPFKAALPKAHTAGIFIGPEGGWDDAEVETARRAGLQMTSLGALVLRAETAVIVASYLVAHSLK